MKREPIPKHTHEHAQELNTEQYVAAHGVTLEDEETELVNFKTAQGSQLIINGRPFAEEFVIGMPVRRTSGEIQEGWMAVGVTSREVELKSGQKKLVDFYVIRSPEGHTKTVSVPIQEALLAEIEAQRAQERAMQPTTPRNLAAATESLIRGGSGMLPSFEQWQAQQGGARQPEAPVPVSAESNAASQEPVQPQEKPQGGEKLPAIADVEVAMQKLKESMLESDRAPAWRYAIALHPYEFSGAEMDLSEGGLILAKEYRRLFQQLQELRSRIPQG